jgi:hypothetical protein
VSKLVWDVAGTRFYESGVDRGVLYAPFFNGVAWNGLISVSETPTGGEAKPYYIDGIKFLNLSAAEEFEATLVAFSKPQEFNVCDGTTKINAGLFVTQQKRQFFGLSYRTKIGNDTSGFDYGYKIHLVYNILAAPSQINNNTVSDEVEPIIYSWSLTTTPPELNSSGPSAGTFNFKPSAHFVIDSKLSSTANLTEIEDILYGSNVAASRLPSVDELITIFKS